MKILIWQQARALGDGIMFSGIPKKIKELYPEAKIDLFCTKTFAQAFRNNKYINSFYFFNTYTTFWRNVPQEKIIFNIIFQLPELLKARTQSYDIIIDASSAYSSFNLNWLKFLKKSTNTKIYGRLNFTFKSKKMEMNIYNVYDGLSVKNNALEFLNIISPPAHDIQIPTHNHEKAYEYLIKFKEKYGNNIKIIIFNGEGSGKKSLSTSKIISCVKSLLHCNKNIFIFFMGYKPCIQKYANIMEQLQDIRINITYETSFNDTCALIKYADLLISVDTSLIHIADAVGTKLVEIYGKNMRGYSPIFPRFVEYEEIGQTENIDIFDPDGFKEVDLCNAVLKLLQQTDTNAG